LGGSFTPNRYDVRYYTRRMTYRAGMRYSQTPMLYDGKSVMDKAVTLGLGMPIRGIGEVNFAAEYGRRGSTANGGVREDYIGIALSLTLMELWFVKYKYE
jgi:hypothetical protein